MTLVTCECCDTMQLLETQLREVLREAQKGRQVQETLVQLVELAASARSCCDSLHRSDPGDNQGLFWFPKPARASAQAAGAVTHSGGKK